MEGTALDVLTPSDGWDAFADAAAIAIELEAEYRAERSQTPVLDDVQIDRFIEWANDR